MDGLSFSLVVSLLGLVDFALSDVGVSRVIAGSFGLPIIGPEGVWSQIMACSMNPGLGGDVLVGSSLVVV